MGSGVEAILLTVDSPRPVCLKRPPAVLQRASGSLSRVGETRFGRGVLEALLAAAVGPAEAQCCCEDGPAALPRLHRAGDEAAAIADSFDVV